MKIERVKEPLWASVLDGQYVVEVQHIDTNEYLLCIFDDETGEAIYSEPTTVTIEPRWGPDVTDVARWQDRAAELVDDKEPPWNKTT